MENIDKKWDFIGKEIEMSGEGCKRRVGQSNLEFELAS
jgi:hypothetical protein